MNYGFEIYVDRKRIRLTEDLLRPLSASAGTTLYGMHYPAPAGLNFLEKDGDYSYAKASHDLVITTIPFDLWPACVAGRIDVKHRHGVLEKVLTALKEYGLNVLHIRCIRSGHRYATISFVAHIIEFGKAVSDRGIEEMVLPGVLEWRRGLRRDLKGKEQTRLSIPEDDSDERHLSAYARALKTEATIIKSCLLRRLGCKELFNYLESLGENADGEQQDHGISIPSKAAYAAYLNAKSRPENILHWNHAFNRTPVGLWALKNLAYFYSFLVNNRTKGTVVRFKATVAEDWSIAFNDPDKLMTLTKLDKDLPSVGFASLDTDSHIIRLAVLSPLHLESFRAVDLNYKFVASSERAFSIGAFLGLVEATSKDWNIWRVYNKSGRYEPGRYGRLGFSTGSISIIMEYDPARGSGAVPSDEDLRDKIQKAAKFDELTIDPKIKIRKFSSRKIFISLKNDSQLDRASEILELCKEIGAEFGFLSDNVRTIESYGTNSISEEVAHAIDDSSGLIQFLMGDDPKSSFTWIEAEFFHATIKELPTVRIVDPRLQGESRLFQDKASILLPEFASSSKFRAAIRSAFKHIAEKISDTGLPRNKGSL